MIRCAACGDEFTAGHICMPMVSGRTALSEPDKTSNPLMAAERIHDRLDESVGAGPLDARSRVAPDEAPDARPGSDSAIPAPWRLWRGWNVWMKVECECCGSTYKLTSGKPRNRVRQWILVRFGR